MIWIGRQVWARITAEGRAYHPLETGGVLLGWRDGDKLIVSGLIGSGPRALHGRQLFLPDHAWQLTQIQEAFSETGGDLDYLGDWHTHPSGTAQMSDQDSATLKRLDRHARGAVMLIAAGAADEWSLGGWSFESRGWLRSAIRVQRDLKIFEPPPDWPCQLRFC